MPESDMNVTRKMDEISWGQINSYWKIQASSIYQLPWNWPTTIHNLNLQGQPIYFKNLKQNLILGYFMAPAL